MTMTPTRQKPTISSGPNVLPFEPVGLAVLGGLAVVGLVLTMGTVERQEEIRIVESIHLKPCTVVVWIHYSG